MVDSRKIVLKDSWVNRAKRINDIIIVAMKNRALPDRVLDSVRLDNLPYAHTFPPISAMVSLIVSTNRGRK